MKHCLIKAKLILVFAIFLGVSIHDAKGQVLSQQPTYSAHFLEFRAQYLSVVEIFPDPAGFSLGVQYTYIPSRVGYYGAFSMNGIFLIGWGPAVNGGLSVRPLGEGRKVDFQLYGGVGLCLFPWDGNVLDRLRPGLDCGIRIAPGAKVGRSKFSWASASIGLSNYWDAVLFTAGISLHIGAPLVGLMLLAG